jgi:hypothetical protein
MNYPCHASSLQGDYWSLPTVTTTSCITMMKLQHDQLATMYRRYRKNPPKNPDDEFSPRCRDAAISKMSTRPWIMYWCAQVRQLWKTDDCNCDQQIPDTRSISSNPAYNNGRRTKARLNGDKMNFPILQISLGKWCKRRSMTLGWGQALHRCLSMKWRQSSEPSTQFLVSAVFQLLPHFWDAQVEDWCVGFLAPST